MWKELAETKPRSIVRPSDAKQTCGRESHKTKKKFKHKTKAPKEIFFTFLFSSRTLVQSSLIRFTAGPALPSLAAEADAAVVVEVCVRVTKPLPHR